MNGATLDHVVVLVFLLFEA